MNHFLRHTRCARLILNGDIIDGWQLRRGGHWTKAHMRFVRIVLKKLKKRNTEVIYVRGNHDDILQAFLPLEFAGLRMVEDYVHEGPCGRYLVLHGDVFDTVTKNFVFLAHLGDWGYTRPVRAGVVQRLCAAVSDGARGARRPERGGGRPPPRRRRY